VRLPQLDFKFAHGAYDDGGKQRGTVSTVEAVEAASEAVIAEESGLPWLKAQVRGDAAGGPLGQSVEGAACEQEVGDEDAKGDGSGDVLGAPAGGREVAREERLELQAVEEVADERYSANFEGFEGGLVKVASHRCLSAGEVGREGCYGGRREVGKQPRGSEKILARLRAARASLARIFSLVKAPGRTRSAG
jgi:hypothetical protein